MTNHLFAADFKETPYWWEAAPRPELPATPLPKEIDVAVIGSGYTGLQAAIQTARGGRSTLVLDAEAAGWGCSSRNGGLVSTSFKPSFAALAAKYGPERAHAILGEGHKALAWIGEFIAGEGLDCAFRVAGRFHGAHNPAAYEKLAQTFKEPQPKGLEVERHLVPRAEQPAELGTEFYHGGAVYPRHASLDPGRYHLGLLALAQGAGATVIPHCAVTGLAREGKGFQLATAQGQVAARQVVVATNGYSGELVPWLKRRIIPIGSYIIATAPLEPALMDRLMPKDRVLTDSRKLVYYYRPSPDRSRIVFGGRVSLTETDTRVSAPKLHADLCAIFPELISTPISHSWMGFVAYSFDSMPHLGQHEGLHYASGYCGSGVSLSSYFGMRLGQQVLGLEEGRTGIDGLTYQTRPFYSGNPWFLAPSIQYYRWRDSMNW